MRAPREAVPVCSSIFSLIAAEISIYKVLNPNSAKYLSKYLLLHIHVVTLISATLLVGIITFCTEAEML